MTRYSILIDGGFLKRTLAKPPARIRDAGPVVALVQAVDSALSGRGFLLHRSYFYDAKPFAETHANPLSGRKINFGDTAIARDNRELHGSLCRQDGFAVRLGECRLKGWNVPKEAFPLGARTATIEAKQLRADIKQVGVDLKIGIDVATLVLKRQVDAIALVAADADFVPVMKMARREGAKVVLVALGEHVHDSMVEHCDINLPLDVGPLRVRPPFGYLPGDYPPPDLPDGP